MDLNLFDDVEIKEPIINEPKDIKKIREELAKMDMAYFKVILDKATFHHKQFILNKTADFEYMEEIQGLEFEIAEVRYIGYQDILNKPLQIAMIKNKTKKTIEELNERKKVLLRITNSTQEVLA